MRIKIPRKYQIHFHDSTHAKFDVRMILEKILRMTFQNLMQYLAHYQVHLNPNHTSMKNQNDIVFTSYASIWCQIDTHDVKLSI